MAATGPPKITCRTSDPSRCLTIDGTGTGSSSRLDWARGAYKVRPWQIDDRAPSGLVSPSGEVSSAQPASDACVTEDAADLLVEEAARRTSAYELIVD